MNLTKEYLDFKIPCIQGHFRESKELGEHKVSIRVRACCDLTNVWMESSLGSMAQSY